MKFLPLVLAIFSVSAQASKNILLIGFWPPTNEMLREFKAPQKNWKNSGFDIYAYYPEFPKGGSVGEGPFRVDFAATFNDFQKYTKELEPVAIIGFGHGAGPWEIETNFPNHFARWFREGRLPSQVGVVNVAVPPSLEENIRRYSSLPVGAIAKRVGWVDRNDDAGDYLCGFLGYLSAWYHDTNPHNQMAGFIHVNMSLLEAKKSLDLTLDAVVENLGK